MLHRAIIIITFYAQRNTCYTSGVKKIRGKGTVNNLNMDKIGQIIF